MQTGIDSATADGSGSSRQLSWLNSFLALFLLDQTDSLHIETILPCSLNHQKAYGLS